MSYKQNKNTVERCFLGNSGYIDVSIIFDVVHFVSDLFKHVLSGPQLCIPGEKQEAHGPRVAHLSDIATADMQMLCNIFPILSSQLMKRSSFKQFFILKKKIYGMPVN